VPSDRNSGSAQGFLQPCISESGHRGDGERRDSIDLALMRADTMEAGSPFAEIGQFSNIYTENRWERIHLPK
jgi:hypothetical protein